MTIIIYVILTIIFVLMGISIFNGNSNLIHSYHQKKVVDKRGYCRAMGTAMLWLGAVFFLLSVINTIRIFAEIPMVVDSVVVYGGLIVGLFLMYKAQRKYNGSWF